MRYGTCVCVCVCVVVVVSFHLEIKTLSFSIRFKIRGPVGEGSVFAIGSSDTGACKYVGYRGSTDKVDTIFGTFTTPHSEEEEEQQQQ